MSFVSNSNAIKPVLWVKFDKFFHCSFRNIGKWDQIGPTNGSLVSWIWSYLSHFKSECNKIVATSYSWPVLSLSRWDRWQKKSNSTLEVNIDVLTKVTFRVLFYLSFANSLNCTEKTPVKNNLWLRFCCFQTWNERDVIKFMK